MSTVPSGQAPPPQVGAVHDVLLVCQVLAPQGELERPSQALQLRQGEAGVSCNLPAVVSVSGKPTIVMPDDQLYPQYDDRGEES